MNPESNIVELWRLWFECEDQLSHRSPGLLTACVCSCCAAVQKDYGNKTIMGFGIWREDTVAESWAAELLVLWRIYWSECSQGGGGRRCGCEDSLCFHLLLPLSDPQSASFLRVFPLIYIQPRISAFPFLLTLWAMTPLSLNMSSFLLKTLHVQTVREQW